jgi:DNA-directed RNA polymerase subunit RPC12/RpoP
MIRFVKFSCERCGKRYATAETPAPGRVYKIKCKACGHLIVVKASVLPPGLTL